MLAAFNKNALASYSDCILERTSFGKGTPRVFSEEGKLGAYGATKIQIFIFYFLFLDKQASTPFLKILPGHRNKRHC